MLSSKWSHLIFALTFFHVGTSWAQQEQDVLINMFATDLTGCDQLSACDTVVTIMCASASSDWVQCGKTAEVKDDNFPVFPERFTFHFVPNTEQRWRFDVVDQDVLVPDPIGSVTISMEEFINTTPPFGTARFQLPNGRGNFFVHHRENSKDILSY